MGCRSWGSGFAVQGFGFRVDGLYFLKELGYKFHCLGFSVSGFVVQGLACK